LRQKIEALIKLHYGAKSEKIDPAQLQLLLAGLFPEKPDSPSEPEGDDAKDQKKSLAKKAKAKNHSRLEGWDQLEVAEETILPDQHIVPDVLADPQVSAYCRGLAKPDGSRVPGFIIPFSAGINSGRNFFNLPLAPGDHAYGLSSFATEIAAVGLAFKGYVEMTEGDSVLPNALSATPYAYLIPCGTDFMRDPMGDTGAIRSWKVADQALPMPYNLGGSDFNNSQFFTANARLMGRSVWNSQWKIVIPAITLSADEQKGLSDFSASVQDIQLFLRTYSNSGN